MARQYVDTLKEKLTVANKEIDRLNSTIKLLKKQILSDPNFPSWFYGNEIDNQTMHIWIKEKDPGPKVIRYLFSHFEANRNIFNEMVNSDSPFFVSSVKKALSQILPVENDLVNKRNEVEDLKRNILSLTSQISSKTNERNILDGELEGKSEELKALSLEVDRFTVDKQTIEAEIQNLQGKDGVEKIGGFISQVQGVLDSILDSGEGSELMLKERLINSDMVRTIELLKDASRNLMEYMKAEPFSNVDVENLKSDIVKEKEKLRSDVEAVRKEDKSVLDMKTSNLVKKAVGHKVSIQNLAQSDPEIKFRMLSEDFNNIVSVLDILWRKTQQVEKQKPVEQGLDPIRREEKTPNFKQIRATQGDTFDRLKQMNDEAESGYTGMSDKQRRKLLKRQKEAY